MTNSSPSIGPFKHEVWSMNKDKDRGRRLTREELAKKIKQGYNILKTCLYLNLINILSAKITKALKIVNRDIAFDSFCL